MPAVNAPVFISGILLLIDGKVIVVASVPANVTELLAVSVLPSAIVNVAPEAGAVIVTLFIVVAVAAPNTGVVRLGLVPNTNAPVPVSPVIAANKFALDGVAKNVATFVPNPLTPVLIGNPVALVNVAAEGVPRSGVTRTGEVAKTAAPLPVSSDNTPASCEDVVVENALKLFDVVASVPEVGSVTLVSPVVVRVKLNAPEVTKFPPSVIVLLPLFTPVPPYVGLIKDPFQVPVPMVPIVLIFDDPVHVDKAVFSTLPSPTSEEDNVPQTGAAPFVPVPVCVKNFFVEVVFGDNMDVTSVFD